MATSEISTIPHLEEICREAVRIGELGDQIDGEHVSNISEGYLAVCENDDVIAMIRKALPEIESLVILKATDEDESDSLDLEDKLALIISTFLIASARIQRVPRGNAGARRPRQSRKQDPQTLSIPQQPSTIKTFPLAPAKVLAFNPQGKAIEDVKSADYSYLSTYLHSWLLDRRSEEEIAALAYLYRDMERRGTPTTPMGDYVLSADRAYIHISRADTPRALAALGVIDWVIDWRARHPLASREDLFKALAAAEKAGSIQGLSNLVPPPHAPQPPNDAA
jgi:hypothetical protein